MQSNDNPLSKYPTIPLRNLRQWSPSPQKFLHYEKYNENYGTVPGASLSLRESDLAMCLNSNGYLSWWADIRKWPARNHMSRFYSDLLEQCNREVRAAKSRVKLDLGDAIVIPHSSIYCDWNQGHDLSVTVYTHLTYTKVMEQFPDREVYIVTSEQAIPAAKNSTDLLYKLVPIDRIIRLKTNTLYEFDNYVTPATNYFDLKTGRSTGPEDPLVNQTLDYIATCVSANPLYRPKLQPIITKCGGKFVLAKTNQHKMARRAGIVPDNVLDSLINNGWYVINPEQLSLMEVIYLVQNATKVVLGSGSINYSHRYFINREAQIYALFNSQHNYSPFIGQKETNMGFAEEKNPPQKWNNFIRRIENNEL